MFKNKDFKIATNHLDLCINESEEAVKEIMEIINEIKKSKDFDQKKLDTIIEKLQFQDICAQRLKKVQNFLKEIDKNYKSNNTDLEEFAWENEVIQDDVDDILKSYGL